MTLNVGIIGLGVGRKHAEAWAVHPGCRVAALCDHSHEALGLVGAEHPGAMLTTDALALLDSPGLDVVSIASYDADHAAQVLRALRNGRHVFAEKPLCQHDHELRAIRSALAARPGLRLSSNLNLRSCPRFALARSLAQEGKMGDVFALEADYLWGRSHKLTRGWRGDQEFYSIIHGAAVHVIDLALWILGRRPTTVQGLGNAIATRGSKMRFNDYAALLLGFEDGLVARITANSGCVHPHFHNLTVYGTAMTFTHGHAGARLYTPGPNGPEHHPVLEEYPGVAHKRQLIHTFAEAILGGSAPLVDAEDVFATMSVCLAAERAVAENAIIDIEYV